MSEPRPSETVAPSPAEKVKQFPTMLRVYFMKDAQGRVVYIGRANNLRSRASRHFTQSTAGKLPLQKPGNNRTLISGC
jgi:excinuclease ABC subunit C